VPWPKGYASNFTYDAYRLGALPRVETYRQFIFATFNMDLPPLAEHLGPATEYLDAWLDRYPTGNVVVRGEATKTVMVTSSKLVMKARAPAIRAHTAAAAHAPIGTLVRVGSSRSFVGSTPARWAAAPTAVPLPFLLSAELDDQHL